MRGYRNCSPYPGRENANRQIVRSGLESPIAGICGKALPERRDSQEAVRRVSYEPSRRIPSCILRNEAQAVRARTNAIGRIEHRAGDRMYVDFAGDRLEIVDEATAEVRKVEVFVAILPCSHYTYCEAVWSQKREDHDKKRARTPSVSTGSARAPLCRTT